MEGCYESCPRMRGGQQGAPLTVCSDPQALAPCALNLPANQGAGMARGQADTCLEMEAPRRSQACV